MSPVSWKRRSQNSAGTLRFGPLAGDSSTPRPGGPPHARAVDTRSAGSIAPLAECDTPRLRADPGRNPTLPIGCIAEVNYAHDGADGKTPGRRSRVGA